MLILLKQMVILFLIMIVGYIAARCKIITPEVSKKLSAIVLNVANPALILKSGMTVKIDYISCLQLVGMAVGMYAILIGLSYLIPLILRIPRDKAGVYRLMLVFSNIGFMGIPLVSSMYGEEAVLKIAIFNIMYNILIYTFGIAQLSSGKGKEKVEATTGTADGGVATAATEAIKSPSPLRKILNVGVIGAVLAIVLAFLQLPIPEMLVTFTGYLGNLTAPLSMMIIGASFLGMKPKELFCDVKLDIFIALKLLVIPAIGLLVLRAFGMQGTMLGIFLVLLGTPVGSMTAMLAQQYNGDTNTTTRGVALSTILSVATMPLLSLLLV